MAVDAQGRLWVTEAIDSPKRVSVWDTQNGALLKEFFGDAHYSSLHLDGPSTRTKSIATARCGRLTWTKKPPIPSAPSGGSMIPVRRALSRRMAAACTCSPRKTAINTATRTTAPIPRCSSCAKATSSSRCWLLCPVTASGDGRRSLFVIRPPRRRFAIHVRPGDPLRRSVAWVDADNDGSVQPEEIGAVLAGTQSFSCADRD